MWCLYTEINNLQVADASTEGAQHLTASTLKESDKHICGVVSISFLFYALFPLVVQGAIWPSSLGLCPAFIGDRCLNAAGTL